MLGNQVSLTNLMLNIKSNIASGLILNKGEIVSGQVQEVKPDGMISLLIQGKLVEALSEVSVEKGQQVYLSVEDFRDGRIYLKLVTPEALSRLGESSLAENLKTMGVNADQQNLEVAKKLIQYGLPARRENINEVIRAVKIIGGFTPQNVELSVMTLAGKLPLNEPVLTAIKQYFSSDYNIGRLLENLIRLVNININSPGITIQQPLETDVQHIESRIPRVQSNESRIPPVQSNESNINLTPKEEALPRADNNMPAGSARQLKTNADKPAAFPQTAPASHQQNIITPRPAGYIPGQAQSENLPPAPAVVETSNQSEMGRKQALGLVRELLRELVISDQADVDINSARMEARSKGGKPLLRNLASIQDLLIKLGTASTAQGRELLSCLADVEKEIGSQQFVNYIAGNYTGNENQTGCFYISFPVQIENHYRQVRMRIEREGDQRPLKEADRLSLVVALDTLNLGRVLFHVDWTRTRQLAIKGVVEKAPVGKFLENNLFYLTQALLDQGYQVENRGIAIAQNIDEEVKFKLNPGESPEELKILRIDITV